MRRISTTGFRIARRGTSREINRQIALNLVRSKQPVSRAELARLMGVRRGAVSRLVNELLGSGLVFEGAKGESKRGRKPMHLYIETRRRCVMAADVSASRTAIMVTDLLGHPMMEVRELPTRRRPHGLVKELATHIRGILAAHPEFGACVGLGVVISGIVDLDGRRLRFSPTLGWRDVDLLEPLKAALKLPVIVENSVKACVLAQVWAVRGDAGVEGPVAFVNVSDGVGVGIAIDGKLLRGAHNLAGEFGHLTLNIEGPLCSCGQKGCWEAYVSKRAVIARYLGTNPDWSGQTQPPGASMDSIIARARGGEAKALQTLERTGHYLGQGFAGIVKAIDPRRIYVGGELTMAWDLIAPAVRGALRAHTLIREAGEVEILTVPLGEYPRLRGAAALVCMPAFAAPIVA
jgi:predicted NBD/HSP70 family sugar kinase